MPDQWLFKSETYDNCNCQINCGCQFNLPSTNGYCQSTYIGHIIEGHFNDTPLVGLNWAVLYKWPGEIKELTGEPFHIALARPSGSFEFTYAELGLGTTSVTGDMEMAFEDTWALFVIHHFNQDGLVRERSRLTAWL